MVEEIEDKDHHPFQISPANTHTKTHCSGPTQEQWIIWWLQLIMSYSSYPTHPTPLDLQLTELQLLPPQPVYSLHHTFICMPQVASCFWFATIFHHILHAALILLQCLNAFFPLLMDHLAIIYSLLPLWLLIASKVICSDTYLVNFWPGPCSSSARSTRWSAKCANILIRNWTLNLAPLRNLKTWLPKILLTQAIFYVLQTILKLAATSTNPFPTTSMTQPLPLLHSAPDMPHH